ncbi:hypothetical protein [Sinorhizobium meliloti]|uniref:hypothetical protein n=1 Tax=Rhizobium meliloti TaxID=382 RepID=UPI000FD40357|nr:hypothetical protein [Sinorhizobium meliloti]MDW9572107.1 hypothetical protein [Sinorhizobium meliloti]MQX63640.1 hypothetical protein [Sinorhizobium meliloti]MQX63713.1 hypothetical protein [Sinorhizobium meliloti]RVJ99202.1 hypothetical protein CN173_06940 [Sinorhizobium meliloti]
MSEFQDIKIVDMDAEASGNSGEGALKRIVLRLSHLAPVEWASMFDEAWRTHHYMMKRQASVAGNSLTVICNPDDLQGLITELKKVISQTNAAFRQMTSEAEVRAAAAVRKAAEDRQALQDLKGKLNFD